MRRTVFAAVLASAVIGMIMTGCDLLNREVLIDDGGNITRVDSTRLRTMNYTADSTHLVITSTADWQATLTDGDGWCTISKTQGRKGTDTIHIFVQENSSTTKRKAQIAVVAGSLTVVYWVVQNAAEEWIDVPYWDRTALQRMGMHGKVDTMRVSDNWHPDNFTEYVFDSLGNVQSQMIVENGTRTALVLYEYDRDNHRTGCTVKDFQDNIVREWAYEYENTGKYVAYSAHGWMDQDPLSEDMEGMVVPGLSAVHKSWREGQMVYNEDREYTFEQEYLLVITVHKWSHKYGYRGIFESEYDTCRVTYQYTSDKLLLPKKSRGFVTDTYYYPKGMLYTFTTTDGEYRFKQNLIKMVVERYDYKGSDAHEIDYYECDYNNNHDLVERRTKYSGSVDIAIDRYPQYQYDKNNNWYFRYEETSNHEKYTQRTITYY